MKQGMQESYEKGVANHSAPSFALGIARCTAKRTPVRLGSSSKAGRTMASSTSCAPSLALRSLRRHSSEIRAACANERPCGSVRGAIRDDRPYRDLTEEPIHPVEPASLRR